MPISSPIRDRMERGLRKPLRAAGMAVAVALGSSAGQVLGDCPAVSHEAYQGPEQYQSLRADDAYLDIWVYDETPTGLVPLPDARVGLPIRLIINSVPREILLPENLDYEGIYSKRFDMAPRGVPRGTSLENQLPDGEVTFEIAYDDDDCPDPVDATGSFSFPPRNLHVADYTVVDYGDGDGFADPGEILDLFPRIVNRLGYDLTEMKAVVSSDDARVVILRNEAEYGSLAAGGETATPAAEPIRLVVTDDVVERGRWPFRIEMHAAEFTGPSRESALSLAAARDVASDPGPGPDFEENFDSPGSGGDGGHGFELGPLFPVNTEALIDGSRCQTSDFLYRPFRPEFCRPWKGSDWHLDTHAATLPVIARSGDGALHMGRHLTFSTGPQNPARLRDVTWGQLSAAVSPPIALGLSTIPTLTFWQIASLQNTTAGGVLQVSTDGGLSWSTVHEMPVNGPADQAVDEPGLYYIVPTGCTFDPIDDGTTEDDLFDPPNPLDEFYHRGYAPSGPSSVCRGLAERPVRTWATMGDAESGNGIRHGSEQTVAQAGSTGGTWAQSVANLQGYRGETVLLRFLTSTTNQNRSTNPDATTGSGWGNVLNAFAFALDFTRGWFLDDVHVTGTAAAPVELVSDLEPPPPPVVLSVAPVAGAEEVEALPAIALAFSQPMDAGTLSADTLTLTGPLGRIEASRSLVQDGLGASLVPTSPLLDGTAYEIAAGAGLLNVAGAPLVPFGSSFTTAPFRATDPSRAHPPVDAEVSGFAVPAVTDVDQVSLRVPSHDLGGGVLEPVLEAEVVLANGQIGFDVDSTITLHLDFGEEGIGSAAAEPGLTDTQDVSLMLRFRNPATSRRDSRAGIESGAPRPRFTGFPGLGDLSSVGPDRVIFRLRLADLLAAASSEQRAAAAAAADGTLTLRAWVVARLRGERDHMPDTEDNQGPTIASETLALRFAAP